MIFQPNNSTKVQLLRPDESVQAIVKLTQTNVPTHKYLRVVGNIQMPAPFEHRGEEMFRRAEYLIDDNLDSLVRKQDTYSLYFKGNGEAFERYAYYRIEQKQFKSGRLEIQVPVIRQNKLNILPSGEFGIELEVFYNKPGRAAEDIYDAPDSILFMPIPAGTSDYREVKQSFLLPENVACILLRVGGYLFSGECWVEAPRLYQEGKQIAQIPFVKHAQRTDEKNYWVGVNLATRSWPRWSLKRNGQPIFEGNIFDRASNVADFYIPLPADTKPGDQLELSLRKEAHRAAFPYELRSIEVIEETARPFEVISVPRFVRQESEFGVLVETNQPNVRLQVQAKGSKPSEQIIEFANEGLHVVQLRADEAGQSIPLSFESAGQVIRDTVCQVIAQTGAPVYISSGDEIYMDKEYDIYDYFFKWYVSQRVGNWYQFRPSYQWSGFRMADPEVIRHYVLLLDQLKMPYAWQVEGRTLASTQINPSLETLRTDADVPRETSARERRRLLLLATFQISRALLGHGRPHPALRRHLCQTSPHLYGPRDVYPLRHPRREGHGRRSPDVHRQRPLLERGKHAAYRPFDALPLSLPSGLRMARRRTDVRTGGGHPLRPARRFPCL